MSSWAGVGVVSESAFSVLSLSRSWSRQYSVNSAALSVCVLIRDAKFRPGGPAGPNAQARPVFCGTRTKIVGLGGGDHNVLRIGCRASCGARKMLAGLAVGLSISSSDVVDLFSFFGTASSLETKCLF